MGVLDSVNPMLKGKQPHEVWGKPGSSGAVHDWDVVGKGLDKAGGAISQGWKDAGDWLGENNPFKKKEVTNPGDAFNPAAITPIQVGGPGAGPGGGMPTGPASVNVASTAGPTAAQINMMPQNQFRENQLALAQQLMGQASGTGPSVAENQFRAASEQNLAATLAAANSARGGANPALQRAALQANAQTQGQMAQDVATQRMQEQMQAAGLLGQVAASGRGQDSELASQQAALNQQAALAGYQGNLQTNLAQAQIDAQMQQQFTDTQAKYAAMGLDAQKANQLAALEVEKLKYEAGADYAKMKMAADAQNQGMIGNLVSAFGGLMSSFAGRK